MKGNILISKLILMRRKTNIESLNSTYQTNVSAASVFLMSTTENHVWARPAAPGTH